MIPAASAGALAAFLDDPECARIWIPEEDDARWDDPEDHGDPKIERWARALGQLGPEIAVAATIACADLIAVVWRIDVGTSAIDDALAASRAAERIDAALSRLAVAETQARQAHTHDAWRAARCALVAARDPASAGYQLPLAALFAFRVIAWSQSRVTEGERALADQVGALAVGTDNADQLRQTLRRALRGALLG